MSWEPDHLRIGKRFVQMFSMSSTPAASQPCLFNELTSFNCDSVLCTTWRPKSGASVRKEISAQEKWIDFFRVRIFQRVMAGRNFAALDKVREQRWLPFPDGAIIVALHWSRVPSDEDNKAFGHIQAFLAGTPVNMQVMVKDSKKYAATGGGGFADFRDGKPSDEAVHKACFSCHEPAKDRDFVFTRYAP